MNIYILAGLLLFTVSSSSLLPDRHSDQKPGKADPAKIVFKSTDGGQTWQDISKGLPENLQEDNLRGNSFFANDKGLFLKVGKGLYHNTPNAATPFWTKESLRDEHSSIAPGKSGISANNYWGVNLKNTNGTSIWSPIFSFSYEPRIRSVFETTGGEIFLGTDMGLFKTANNGKSWKLVYEGAFVGHLAESDGVLLATGMRRIIRSTDNGESWAMVNSDSSVTFDVRKINGGFAAVTASSVSGTRSLKTSYDAGKTWQPIDANAEVLSDSIWRAWDDRLRLQATQTYITQVGDNFFCTHPEGVFKSSDKGATWKLLLPFIENKGFNLMISGSVIYVIAIPTKDGC